MKPIIIIIIAALFGIATGQANAADPPAKVLAAFGLTGTWSVACDQPVGPRNPRVSYVPRPDGQVDGVADFGEGGPARSTVRDAFIDRDHRLHTTVYTTFDSLPKTMKEALQKAGSHANVTNRSVVVLGADGALNTEDSFADLEGSTLHIVSGGYVINPATQAPGPKMPARFKCP